MTLSPLGLDPIYGRTLISNLNYGLDIQHHDVMIIKVHLKQWSQTRGPREGPMRPANIRKNGDFKRNIGPIGLFSQKHCLLTQKFFFIFLMRPARPYFQSHAARETL